MADDNVIELIIEAIDNATGVIGKVDDSVGELGEGLEALKTSAEGLVAAFAVDKIVDAISEVQAANAQLDAGFKATGATLALTRSQLDGYAASLAKTTTASGTTVKEAEAILLTFDKVRGQAFGQTLQAAADLSARLGTDLPEATRILGRALQDPETGLQRLTRAGVTFTEQQKDLIKQLVETGQAAEAQQVIIKNVEDAYGGAAAAAAGTLGGALKQLKGSFGELFDIDTGNLVSSIQQLRDIITSDDFKSGVGLLATGVVLALNTIAQAAKEAYESYQGLKILLGGGNDDIVNLDTQITNLKKQIADRSAAKGGFLNDLIDPDTQAEVVSMTTKLRAMEAEYQNLVENPLHNVSPSSKLIATLTPKEIELVQAQQATKTLKENTAGAAAAMDNLTIAWGEFERSHPEEIFGDVGNDSSNKSGGQVIKDLTETMTAAEKESQEYYDQLQKINDLLANGFIGADEAKKRLDFLNNDSPLALKPIDVKSKLKPVTTDTQDALNEMDALFKNEFGKIIDSGQFTWAALADSLVKAFEKKEIFNAIDAITTYFKQSLSSSSGGVGGFISSVLGFFSGGGSSTGASTTPGYDLPAAGGGYKSGLVRVGETGPEIVALPQGSRVYNSAQLAFAGFSGGGASVNFAPNYAIGITADDSTKTKQQLIQYMEYRSAQDKAELYRNLSRNGINIVR